SNFLRRSEPLVVGRLSENTGRDRRGREARRQSIPRQSARRFEHRAARQNRSRVARRQEHDRHRSVHRESGDQAMSARFTRVHYTARRALAVSLLFAAPVAAQQSKAAPKPKSAFDRRVVPPTGKDPELNVPAWTKATLANGATLVVAERHALPLVAVQIN